MGNEVYVIVVGVFEFCPAITAGREREEDSPGQWMTLGHSDTYKCAN